MKIEIDFKAIKEGLLEEYKLLVEDPKERLIHYAGEFNFLVLKMAQDAIEQLDYQLTQLLENALDKREPVIFTPEEPVIDVELPELEEATSIQDEEAQ